MMKNKLYESLIDTHIEYLLFLNSNYKLSNIGFLELAPIIDEIRYELYDKIKNMDIIDNTNINNIIINMIQESLNTRGLVSVISYVDAFIESDDINNIGLAVFLRRVSDDMNIHTGNKIADQFINKIHSLIPASDLSIDSKETSLIEYYLNSLRIKYDEKQDIKVYILEILSYINIVCRYLSIECDLLSDNTSLDDIVDVLNRLSIRLNSFKKEFILAKSN